MRLVNTSQIDCYNTYNCKSISKASNSIDYELECQTYGLIDQSKDCKCSFNRPEVCQLPIDQFNSNCNGQKLCTQPIHDRKCRIKVSECYTIKAKLGFSTLDGNQVITSDQTLTCKSDDIACPQSQISKIEPGKNIWYRSTDGTDWSYESYNPNENCNIAMIVIGGVLILSVCFCCCGVVASAISTGSRSIPEPVRQLNSSNENPIHCLQPQPNLHSSSNEEVQRSQENSIELVERSRQSSEISIQLSKHSSSQSQIF